MTDTSAKKDTQKLQRAIVDALEDALLGKPLSDASINAAIDAAIAICDPAEDLRGDVEYKTAMAGQMLKRAIRTAAARCA